MINILDKYTQISFDVPDDEFKYSGTCNVKDNKVNSVNISISTIDTNYRIGTMTTSSGYGASVSIDNVTDLVSMQKFITILQEAKQDLEKELSKNL